MQPEKMVNCTTRGYNYLIHVDADLKTEEQVEYDCVRADTPHPEQLHLTEAAKMVYILQQLLNTNNNLSINLICGF